MKEISKTPIKCRPTRGVQVSPYTANLHTTTISELEMLRTYMVPAHVLDHKGLILYANLRELEILGYVVNEYVGKHFNEFVCTGM